MSLAETNAMRPLRLISFLMESGSDARRATMLRDIRYLDEGSSFGPWHLTWQDPRLDTLPRLLLPERKRETIRGQAVPYDETRPISEAEL